MKCDQLHFKIMPFLYHVIMHLYHLANCTYQILKNESGVSQAAKQRNEIRKSIKSFFRSINAFTLPVPSHEREVLKNMGKPKNNKNINGEFLVKLDILKTIIAEKYQSKKGINDSHLTGTRTYPYLWQYKRTPARSWFAGDLYGWFYKKANKILNNYE